MSQVASVIAHLQKGKTITPLEALDKFGCFRLAAVIHDIRSMGFVVETEMVERNDKRFARYRMVPD